MYISSSVHLPHPVQEVSQVLLDQPSRWFPGLSAENMAAVGMHLAGVPLKKKVIVEFGAPLKTATWAVVPIAWKATSIERAFPGMTARIEVAPVDTHETRLTVSGMYQAPLGGLGAQLDEAVMHRVAEATVKELAAAIGKRLGSSVGG